MIEDTSDIDFEAFQRRMAESMRWSSLMLSYEEISADTKSIVSNMKRYSLSSALPILAGLMTLPDYQSNCIRLELLVGLAVLHCSGQKKATVGSAVRWFRQIGETKSVLGEDPAEDIFVSLVHDTRGNYRLLEGVWENAGFYTQCILDIVESLPDQEPFSPLKRSFRALLKVSDAICAKAGLERYQLGDEEIKDRIETKKTPDKKELLRRVTFASADFDDLDIAQSDILPFLSHASDHSGMLKQAPGDNSLEHRPLVQVEPEIFVFSLPSAISVCARNLVIDFMHNHGMNDQFDEALSNVFSSLISGTPVLGGMFHAPVHWQKIQGVRFATFSLEFDEGYFLSIHLFLPSISAHRNGGFKTIIEDDGTIAKIIRKGVEKNVEETNKRSKEHKGGLALIVGCGWGKGYAIRDIAFNHNGWMFEFVPVSDLVRISWLSDMSPEYFFRIQQGLKAAKHAGMDFFNMNGVPNLIAWIRKNNGHIIPHHLFLDAEVTDDTPMLLNAPQNLLRDLRWESDHGRDRHRIKDNFGRWHIVQRVQSGITGSSDGSHKLYASIDDVGKGKLSAVLDAKPSIWISISAPNFKSRKTVLRLWEMARLWLPRIITKIAKRIPDDPGLEPIQLQLIFEGTDDFDITDAIPNPNEILELVSVEAASDPNVFNIIMHDWFISGFRMPKNFAERAVVGGMLRAILIHVKSQVSEDMLKNLVKQIVQNDEARSFHAIQAHTFLQYVANTLPNKLVALNEIDDAIVKLGMGLNAGKPREENRITGVEPCTNFLNGVIDDLLENLFHELLKFSRNRALIKIYENIEKANAEEDHWRRTSAALLGLHGDNPEGLQAYVENSSKFSGATVSCRILAEIALCACPTDSGLGVSNLELSRMMTTASLLYRLGGSSDAIKYNALPPELHISPFGDILFKDEFGDFVIQPLLSDVIKKRFKALAPMQEKNYMEPEHSPRVKDKFDSEFWGIWTAEMGFDIDQARVIIDQIEDKGIKIQKAVFELSRSDFIDIVSTDEISVEIANKFLDRFILPTRSKWSIPPKGFALKEIYPWRFGRQLSLVARPILQIDDNKDPNLIVAPNTLRQSLIYLIDGAYSGRLDQNFFTTPEMKNEWMGKASEGHTHTRDVAKQLENAGWKVCVEIKLPKILNMKLSEDFGDIDVLAWKMDRDEILIIECKDLSLARNYTEAAHMLSEFQGRVNQKGEADRLKKHLERFELLSKNKAKLAQFCGIASPKLISALVCSGAVPMQYAKIDALEGSFVGAVDTLVEQFI